MAYTSKYTGNQIDSILSSIYPVGCVYISFNDVSPAGTYSGTWERLEDGYTLWSASSGAGDTISAGLPNIEGSFNSRDGAIMSCGGVFTKANYDNIYGKLQEIGNTYSYRAIAFSASRSNYIYGNSSTVQPPAIKVYMWKRVS